MSASAHHANLLRYVYIEDMQMYYLRNSGIFTYKGMPKELLSLLEDYHRSNLYLLGLRRLLWQLIRGKDFKILTKDGWSSFQYLCRKIDDSSTTRSEYRLKATRTICNTKIKPKLPISSPFGEFFKTKVTLANQYSKYLGGDSIMQLSKRVGNDSSILIHSATSILSGESANTDNSGGYKIEFNQVEIIEKMLKGNDFIVGPFGHSFQAFLTELTSTRGSIYYKFRLKA